MKPNAKRMEEALATILKEWRRIVGKWLHVQETDLKLSCILPSDGTLFNTSWVERSVACDAT